MVEASAIYIGAGRFLTAAHVIDRDPRWLRACKSVPDRPTLLAAPTFVDFARRRLPVLGMLRDGRPARPGDIHVRYTTGDDVVVLAVSPLGLPADLRQLRPAPLCPDMPIVPTPVQVVTRDRTWFAEARDLSPLVAFGNFNTLANYKDSGGGVFDLGRRCLLGILSHRWPFAQPTSTNFAGPAAIRRAMGK